MKISATTNYNLKQAPAFQGGVVKTARQAIKSLDLRTDGVYKALRNKKTFMDMITVTQPALFAGCNIGRVVTGGDVLSVEANFVLGLSNALTMLQTGMFAKSSKGEISNFLTGATEKLLENGIKGNIAQRAIRKLGRKTTSLADIGSYIGAGKNASKLVIKTMEDLTRNV